MLTSQRLIGELAQAHSILTGECPPHPPPAHTRFCLVHPWGKSEAGMLWGGSAAANEFFWKSSRLISLGRVQNHLSVCTCRPYDGLLNHLGPGKILEAT